MKSIDEFLQHLQNVVAVRTNEWKARCPSHNDGIHNNDQSLSIKLEGDKILIHCFALCQPSQIVETLGLKMSDLYLDKPEKKDKPHAARDQKEIDKIYPYNDLSGNLVFEVVRYKPKAFKQRRPNPDKSGSYIYNLKGIQPVIYRLPQITSAISRGETVYHCEGEKDADNLVKLGLEATTSPMGANSWKSSLAAYYTGAKQVVIFPDKDGPGRAYATGVALDIYPKVPNIKIVELPGENVKDASDWIQGGGKREELEKIVASAPAWYPPKPDLTSIDYDSVNSRLKKASNDNYCVLNRAYHRMVHTREGDINELPVCNFIACVTEDIAKDNGADINRFLKIQGRLNGTVLPTVVIPESSFDTMKWVRKEWGFTAQIVAGKSNTDHLVNCITYSSDKVATRTLYTHTGWRLIKDKYVFLTGSGAIGMPNVEVELPDRLSHYRLPQPEGDPKEAIEKSLGILLIGELPVTLPTFILPYLSVLNIFEEISFTPWYLGRSGSLKSVMTALMVSHFGDFTHKTLPVNWFGTRTELEKLSFLAKDVVLPVDDYAPPSDANSARDINRTVEYMIRDVGNRQGRVRSNADMSSQATYYPRGLLVTSGEQLPPPGVSRSARILPIPIRKEDFFADEDLTLNFLTQAQKDKVFYPVAMSHFIKWIQDNWENVRNEFHSHYEEYRNKAPKQGVHLRMIETISLMQTGLYIATLYAQEKGALTDSERTSLVNDGEKILSNLVNVQNTRLTQERPGIRFTDTVRDLLSSGKYILRNRMSGIWSPSNPPPGQGILGWNDPPKVFIIAAEAYKAVTEHCQRSGEFFGTHKPETYQDLQDLGYLVPDEYEDPAYPKNIPGAGTHRVLAFKSEIILPRVEE